MTGIAEVATDASSRLARGASVPAFILDRENQRLIAKTLDLTAEVARLASFAPMMSIAADDGTFTIGDVAPGTYRITAHPNAGGALGGIGAVSFAVNLDGALSGQATITVGSADVTGLTVLADRK
jgi:hypothetical protein